MQGVVCEGCVLLGLGSPRRETVCGSCELVRQVRGVRGRGVLGWGGAGGCRCEVRVGEVCSAVLPFLSRGFGRREVWNGIDLG